MGITSSLIYALSEFQQGTIQQLLAGWQERLPAVILLA